jgi:hypothetical protein
MVKAGQCQNEITAMNHIAAANNLSFFFMALSDGAQKDHLTYTFAYFLTISSNLAG